MPRKLRIQYPGAVYHVMNRGDRGERIFADDDDRERFLRTLGATCGKTGWQVHAYCLMSNHFPGGRNPQPNLVTGMQWFLGTYTMAQRRQQELTSNLGIGKARDGVGVGAARILSSACSTA
jgi:putative transposase